MQSSQWRPLYVWPQDRQHCVNGHIVGISSHSPLLEVAVPAHIPCAWPYQDCPNIRPILIDQTIPEGLKYQYGYLLAHRKAFYHFLETARMGIRAHGTELADYYRRRYWSFRPWIEYLVLLHDLPVCRPVFLLAAALAYRLKPVDPPHNQEILGQKFSQAAILLALSFARPKDEVTESILAMDLRQLMARMREELEKEFNTDAPSLSMIAPIRQILVQVGGPQNKMQMDITHSRETTALTTFYALFGGNPRDLAPRCDTSLLVQKLSKSRAFPGMDADFVYDLARKLGLSLWLSMGTFPPHWVSSFPAQSLESLKALWIETCNLFPRLDQPQNAERVFTIWIYIQHNTHHWRSDAPARIYHDREKIFERACASFIGKQSAPQLALDLMTMTCIARLFSEGGAQQPSYESLVHAFDGILKARFNSHIVFELDRLLLSFARVCSSSCSQLEQFICKLPQLSLVADPTVAQFCMDRISGVPHTDALMGVTKRYIKQEPPSP
ncbi:hypothetical protein ACJZ2D_016762 [Fusarium nematophilum]